MVGVKFAIFMSKTTGKKLRVHEKQKMQEISLYQSVATLLRQTRGSGLFDLDMTSVCDKICLPKKEISQVKKVLHVEGEKVKP